MYHLQTSNILPTAISVFEAHLNMPQAKPRFVHVQVELDYNLQVIGC